MSQTLLKVIALVAQRKVHVSRHAYNELLNDRIFLDALHILWGIPAGKTEPAAIITAYRPDPAKWDAAFLRRKP